ncbi:RodZ domain-containing protein [Chromohalobacter israelensis]|uniref:RodZ domain-containing protein n=1 Tax=Chromohalobacter israelensis TaxID=141390 RepID=UPI003D7BBFC6
MSDTHEQHDPHAPTTGHEPPGTQLRRERERQGLSLEEVAEQLNLRPAVVKGLEEDQYDQVPIATYRRGYLRAYAKLLGVDDKRVAQAYDALHGRDDLDRTVTPAYRSQPPSRLGAWIFKLVTLLIVLGLIGLTLLWWQSREGNEFFGLGDSASVSMETTQDGDVTQEGGDDAAVTESATGDAGASPSATASGDEQGSLPPLPENDSELGLVDDDTTDVEAEAPAADALPEADTAGTDGASPEAAELATTANAGVPEDTDTATDDSAAETADPNRLTLTFNEQSWTEIYDADNQRLLAGLQDAGTQAQVEGTPPFRLTVGNATGVEISYRDDNVDLSEHTGSNNVARFTLGE